MICKKNAQNLLKQMIISLFLIISVSVVSQDQHSLLLEKIVSQDQTVQKKQKQKKTRRNRKINFAFNNESIVDVINTIAGQKEVNILLPVRDADFEKIKISLSLDSDVTIDQAWNVLQTLLELSGYIMIQEADIWKVIKKDKTMNREPLPLFIGIKPNELPKSEDRIRYVYFFSNLKIGDNANKIDNEITVLMNTLLADQSKVDASHYLDQTTNAIILAGKASDIKAAMSVVVYLDTVDIQEIMDVVPLNYLAADFVTNLLQTLQDPTESEKKQNPLLPKTTASTYFSRNVKVIPFGTKNSVILLGKQTDVDRIREFILKYLDVPIKSGKSILHVYKLQYLDADEFARVLSDIVKREEVKKTTGQASGKSLADTSGDIETYFDTVIVKSDKPNKEETSSTQGGAGSNSSSALASGFNKSTTPSYATKSDSYLGNYGGGNKLIVACRESDWIRIKKLIEDLDTPVPQVVIEVLITEMAAQEVKEIASQLRNPACFPMPKNVNAQTAMADTGLATVIVPGYAPGQTPVAANALTTIQSDLLANAFGPTDGPYQSLISPNTVGTVSGAPIGSTVIQASDPQTGRTWGLLEILDKLDASNIVSNPHVIATNNTKTVITANDQRLLPDTSANTGGQGTTTIIRKWADAPVQVRVIPRISGDFINLNLEIDITRFTTTAVTNNAAQQGRNKRQIYTQANVPNGSILALGGLTSNNDDDLNARTPILGRIPLLGYFFKRRSNTSTDATLVVFICPTIIQPRLRSGVSDYTNEHINLTKKYMEDSMNFDSLRDPITRWFFSSESLDQIKEIDDFLIQDDVRAQEYFRTLNQEQTGNHNKKAAEPKKKISGPTEIIDTEASINTVIDVESVEDIQPIIASPSKDLETKQHAVKPEQVKNEQKIASVQKKERPLRTLMNNLENPFKKR